MKKEPFCETNFNVIDSGQITCEILLGYFNAFEIG